MGVAKCGFEHSAVIEWNRHACATIRGNQKLGVSPLRGWPLHESDVRNFNFDTIKVPIDLIAGGPPCQPFSMGGKHQGAKDERNMFPDAIRAVRELRPRAFMFENVRGLTRQSFSNYFQYILMQLRFPEIIRKAEEDWLAHLSRLERCYTRTKYDGLFYRVVARVLNAVDFGVPQKRERVFIVGFRHDLGIEWSFPRATHSDESLYRDKWVTGDYWDRHKVSSQNRLGRPEKIERMLFQPIQKPWLTVRDSISDLPDPKKFPFNSVKNHNAVSGAKSYPGHTGSPLDEPAKTLKAGDHGVPGGENMLRYPNGKLRYFTVRESARLQSFPDEFQFFGTWGESMRQLGNAVPVTLAEVVTKSIKTQLERATK